MSSDEWLRFSNWGEVNFDIKYIEGKGTERMGGRLRLKNKNLDTCFTFPTDSG